MEKKAYEENCTKMQERMTKTVESLLEAMKKTKSPLAYLVMMKKFNDEISKLNHSFTVLANVEYEELKGDGEKVSVGGAAIEDWKSSHKYEYPEQIVKLQEALEGIKVKAREDKTAKDLGPVSEKKFKITLNKS